MTNYPLKVTTLHGAVVHCITANYCRPPHQSSHRRPRPIICWV